MFDIITIGGATVDVFLKTEAEIIRVEKDATQQTMIAYPIGRKILVQQMQHMTGGGATNTAVAVARLGLKTGCVCKIGDDIHGKQIVDELRKEKVVFLGKKQSLFETGCAIILDRIDGSKDHLPSDRTILVCKGANDHLEIKDIAFRKLQTHWLYLSTMLGTSYKTCEQLAAFAEKKKIKIAFNPSYYLVEKGAALLKKILSRTTMLFVNKEEAAALLQVPCDSSPLQINQLLRGCRKLIRNEGIVVITNGAEGAYCYDGTTKYFIQPHKVKVVETTGAGDAFTSTFLACYMKTNEIIFALQFAQTNAESVIQEHGAKNILLHWNQALKHIRKHPHKIQKSRF